MSTAAPPWFGVPHLLLINVGSDLLNYFLNTQVVSCPLPYHSKQRTSYKKSSRVSSLLTERWNSPKLQVYQ